jgi:hypothetical protein
MPEALVAYAEVASCHLKEKLQREEQGMLKTQLFIAAVSFPLLIGGCSDAAAPPGAPRALPSSEAARPALARTASTWRSRVQYNGMSAQAGFSVIDPSGCVETDVQVSSAKLAVKQGPGKPAAGPLAEVNLFQFNYCTFESVSAFGETDDAVFDADQRLNEARLQTTIPAFDFNSNTDVLVEVDLTWRGTGDRSSGSQRERFRVPGQIETTWFKGVFRDAVATGTVVVEGENLTPNESDYALIVRARSGQLIMERTR